MPDYKYAGAPLKPEVYEALTLSLVDGKIIKKSSLSEKVLDLHIRQGGKGPDGRLDKVAEAALDKLIKSHQIQRSMPGFYLLKAFTEGDEITSIQADEVDEVIDELEASIPVESGCVYVYYYPAYKINAELSNSGRWPHKIGMTRGLTKDRVFEHTTGMPEEAVIVEEYTSSNVSLLERTLHGIFKLRGQWLEKAPGKEWFMTNPAELKAVMALLSPEEVG